jgi:hypothetical protein
MGIHPFQIADLNWNFLSTSSVNNTEGSTASELAIVPDNVNGNCSRYLKLQSTWANIAIGAIQSGPNSDSFGQSTGVSNGNSTSVPWRPNGGYFVRGLYFTNTAVPSNDSTGPYRVGYIGSFVAGMLNLDYGHDPNGNPPTVDYEPVYSHAATGGVAVGSEVASPAKQWRDPVNPPSDGTDQIVNSSSALTRTAYMPASYMIFHIDSTGVLGTPNAVTFHMENRPSLRMTGYNDTNGQSGFIPSYAGTVADSTGTQTPYASDPLRNNGGLATSASDNFHEFWQVTGQRKLNTRGLSMHLAKVMDNSWQAMAYPYEEDGSTLGTGVTVTSNNIQSPFTYANDQQQYIWAGGRDRGASITSTSVTANVVTIATPFNNYSTNDVVLIQGLNSHPELNGALLTVSTATSLQFTAAWTHGNYATSNETQGGAATKFQDFRVRNAATFIINEEYYGMVMDTKCTIWSNKSSMFPLLFVDLADTWTGSTAKRIAGVTAVPVFINSTGQQAWKVFFLSEDGKLAIYDFTQTNGVLALATSAPAVAAVGEAYGSFRARSIRATITNIDITTNVLTVQCLNDFEPGEIVNLSGLTTATYLNNQTVTVSTASGTQFTASYTHANDPSHADTGTATGYSLWALYGTMSPDPRLTQTSLANTARIGVVRYLIGTDTWGSVTFSPNTGRHNGRSLNEMMIARDSNANKGVIYILCEDVTVTGGGPFSVSNAFTQTFPQTFNVNWQVMAYDPDAAAWNTSKINGTTLLQYGTNFGPNGVAMNDSQHFWFYNINAFLIDIAPNKIMIQPNWTIGGNGGTSALQILNVSGTTSALANANLSTITPGTLVSGDTGIVPYTISHARDFATNGERTTFFPHDQVRSSSGTAVSLYLAPPSYNWGSPTLLSVLSRNNYSGNPGQIQNTQKDFWSYISLNTVQGNFGSKFAWVYPTMLTDNYMHFVRGSGNNDSLPINSIYGRAFGQTLAYLPTYWKWTGSAWALADSWADAAANPRGVAAPNANIALPYGLQAQFGPSGSTSYTVNEFHTWNMCYGNTKFARKLRQSYAQFAGQTFTNTDTRTVASQNALSMYLIDTDLGSVTLTAPTSSTPHTAVLTNPNLGWNTQTVWNKLDGSNAPHDATSFQIIWTPLNFNNATFGFTPAISVTGTNPYSWSTFQVQASSEQNSSTHPAWMAVDGSPQDWWTSATAGTGTLAVDLGSAQTINSYGFRPVFSSSDIIDGGTPKSWTLEGSNTSLTSGFSAVDTRTNVAITTRSVAFSVGSPASFRYYRINISATQTVGVPTLSMFQLNTSALQTTVNFTEMVFYAYGSQVSASYHYPWIRNWQMARGIKLEVSTVGAGGPYTTVFAPGGTSPLWRALNGYVFTFPRQTSIAAVRITCQHGFNYNTQANSSNQAQVSGFGPFYFIDYGVSQGTLDTARLGSSVAPNGTAARGSFDPNCIGVATDVSNISIDGGNPSLLTPYSVFVDGAVHGFWDFTPVPASQFKMHPFFGFTFFQNAGPNGALSNQTGTSAVTNYQWGRRV